MVVAAVFGVATVVVGATPGAAAPRRLAVVAINHVNLSSSEAHLIAARLAQAIEQRYAVRAVAARAAGARCPRSRACVSRVAAASRADEVLFLVLTRVGQVVQIDAILAKIGGDTETRGPARLELDAASGPGVRAAASVLVPELPLRRHRRRDRASAWVVGGVGLSALALGVGLGVSALSLQREHDESGVCDGPDPIACERSRERIAHRALEADIALAAGVLATGVSILLFSRDRGASGLTVSASDAELSIGYAVEF